MRSEIRTCTVALALTFAAALSPVPASAQTARPAAPALDVSYEPTSQPVVNAMLKLAKVGPDDFLIDLGCGDGRIPITAARRYGTRGLGVDLDPQRIKEARANAEKHRVSDKVNFIEGDLFKTDIDKASVIALFLYPELNLKLRPRLLQLTPGTRVVSHEHDMGDWRPDSTNFSGERALHFWVVPAQIGGDWQLVADGLVIDLKIEQKYQRLRGFAIVNGRQLPIRNGRITGAQAVFDLGLDGSRLRRFTGLMSPAGTMEGGGWQAKRKS